MTPPWHIFWGAVCSIPLYYFSLASVPFITLFFIASFMIDVDHYFLYVWKMRKMSPFSAVRWFYNHRNKILSGKIKIGASYQKPLFIFHNVETLIILGILGIFVSFYFYAILLGLSLHLFLDYIDLTYVWKQPLYPKISLFYVLKRNKNKKSIFN